MIVHHLPLVAFVLRDHSEPLLFGVYLLYFYVLIAHITFNTSYFFFFSPHDKTMTNYPSMVLCSLLLFDNELQNPISQLPNQT